MYLIGFPLLVIPFAIYNMIAFLTPSLSWTDKVATFHLVSGQDWTASRGEFLRAFSVLQLGLAFPTPSLSWTDQVATVHLVSGQDWPVTPEEILLAFTVLLLGVEIGKATRT